MIDFRGGVVRRLGRQRDASGGQEVGAEGDRTRRSGTGCSTGCRSCRWRRCCRRFWGRGSTRARRLSSGLIGGVSQNWAEQIGGGHQTGHRRRQRTAVEEGTRPQPATAKPLPAYTPGDSPPDYDSLPGTVPADNPPRTTPHPARPPTGQSQWFQQSQRCPSVRHRQRRRPSSSNATGPRTESAPANQHRPRPVAPQGSESATTNGNGAAHRVWTDRSTTVTDNARLHQHEGYPDRQPESERHRHHHRATVAVDVATPRTTGEQHRDSSAARPRTSPRQAASSGVHDDHPPRAPRPERQPRTPPLPAALRAALRARTTTTNTSAANRTRPRHQPAHPRTQQPANSHPPPATEPPRASRSPPRSPSPHRPPPTATTTASTARTARGRPRSSTRRAARRQWPCRQSGRSAGKRSGSRRRMSRRTLPAARILSSRQSGHDPRPVADAPRSRRRATDIDGQPVQPHARPGWRRRPGPVRARPVPSGISLLPAADEANQSHAEAFVPHKDDTTSSPTAPRTPSRSTAAGSTRGNWRRSSERTSRWKGRTVVSGRLRHRRRPNRRVRHPTRSGVARHHDHCPQRYGMDHARRACHRRPHRLRRRRSPAPEVRVRRVAGDHHCRHPHRHRPEGGDHTAGTGAASDPTRSGRLNAASSARLVESGQPSERDHSRTGRRRDDDRPRAS